MKRAEWLQVTGDSENEIRRRVWGLAGRAFDARRGTAVGRLREDVSAVYWPIWRRMLGWILQQTLNGLSYVSVSLGYLRSRNISIMALFFGASGKNITRWIYILENLTVPLHFAGAIPSRDNWQSLQEYRRSRCAAAQRIGHQGLFCTQHRIDCRSRLYRLLCIYLKR